MLALAQVQAYKRGQTGQTIKREQVQERLRTVPGLSPRVRVLLARVVEHGTAGKLEALGLGLSGADNLVLSTVGRAELEIMEHIGKLAAPLLKMSAAVTEQKPLQSGAIMAAMTRAYAAVMDEAGVAARQPALAAAVVSYEAAQQEQAAVAAAAAAAAAAAHAQLAATCARRAAHRAEDAAALVLAMLQAQQARQAAAAVLDADLQARKAAELEAALRLCEEAVADGRIALPGWRAASPRARLGKRGTASPLCDDAVTQHFDEHARTGFSPVPQRRRQTSQDRRVDALLQGCCSPPPGCEAEHRQNVEEWLFRGGAAAAGGGGAPPGSPPPPAAASTWSMAHAAAAAGAADGALAMIQAEKLLLTGAEEVAMMQEVLPQTPPDAHAGELQAAEAIEQLRRQLLPTGYPPRDIDRALAWLVAHGRRASPNGVLDVAGSFRKHRGIDDSSPGSPTVRSLRFAEEAYQSQSSGEEEEEEGAPAGMGSPGPCSALVNALYVLLHTATGALGGNGAGGAIYGELAKAAFQRVLDFLVRWCELGPTSTFMDIGSGLGKPNFHACVEAGLRYSVGVEIDKVRWYLSLVNLQAAVGRSLPADAPRVMFTNANITAAKTLDPFTHVYMFDTGFPPRSSAQIAAAFNASRHTKYLVCFHPPRLVLGEWGLEAECVGRVQTSMSGSSEGHLCFFYKATGKRDISDGYSGEAGAAAVTGGNRRMVDPVFAESMRLLDGEMDYYLASVAQMVDAFHRQPRTRGGRAAAGGQ